MGVDSASSGVLAPSLIGLSCEAAQLPASLRGLSALPARLWVQKWTEGGGSYRVEPIVYDDVGGNIMGPERQHYGFRHKD